MTTIEKIRNEIYDSKRIIEEQNMRLKILRGELVEELRKEYPTIWAIRNIPHDNHHVAHFDAYYVSKTKAAQRIQADPGFHSDGISWGRSMEELKAKDMGSWQLLKLIF